MHLGSGCARSTRPGRAPPLGLRSVSASCQQTRRLQAAAYGAMLGGLMCALELRGLREKRPSAGTSYRRALLCRRSQPESVLAPDAGLAELTQR